MKFGETFTEYLRGEEEWFLEKCRHVEYKNLKKVLKKCKTTCNTTRSDDEHINSSATLSDSCQCQSCPWCDEMFFEELMKEVSDIAGFFKSRVRHLLHIHVASGMQRYMMRLRRCFRDEKQALVEEGKILIQYITMNAIAIRKILKKYDKVHGSDNGKNFKLKMRAERIELLHSPWLIELGAFYLNSGLDKVGNFKNSFGRVSCENLNKDQPVMKLMLPNTTELEFDLTCAICLETVFNPYALKCGHIFCKACACSAASVMIFQGVKAAPQCSKCPICREVGVYAEAVHMIELHLLLKIRCKEYWKERIVGERSEMVKQSKMFWNEQTIHMIGCDEMFFAELMKEVSDIAGFFKSRVRHLLHIHVATGMQRYMMRLRRCFADEKQALVEEGQILIQYITMNAIAIRKILKKYDKVHGSDNGKNFKLKMRAERIELLHSPWLIELGAFYLNSGLDKVGNFKNSFGRVSCENLNEDQSMMKLTLPNTTELEFDLTCAICLETVFNPYALKCGHIFCKVCACSAASVMIFQGVKAAPQCSKCPICREVGVYAEAVHMIELHLLLKIRCKEYWKERVMGERSEMVKQSKMFWNEQTIHMIGY
ncbi:hypothetical protein F2Q68_00001659 [Brassica cretica]|uniref:RING-type E3 ubiquitin transferase n=1 Tax=Brassica cretica TaxID=69181 RepID=A0A8S9JG03_BRACR|nr:hypothetical protein F2Q68_00001659 [Brassica cretica]